ncbi:hypothetical protein niasHS_015679 [Heterodera schachtii]|uniref:SPRY domain-containing protein n=1 Tax=Heterodera schachtii TaxID=97005 RepID=A0ABD2HPN9_HETSC
MSIPTGPTNGTAEADKALFPNLGPSEELRLLRARIQQLEKMEQQQNMEMESSSNGNSNEFVQSGNETQQQQQKDHFEQLMSIVREEQSAKFVTMENFLVDQLLHQQTDFLAKIDELAKIFDNFVGIENSVAKFKQFENFVGVLKDRFGKELLNAVHSDFRPKIAEKFSNPPQNCWNANDCHGDIQIFGPECLTVQHKGNERGRRIRSVFAQFPIPNNDSGIFYYEIKFINLESYGYKSDGTFWVNGFCVSGKLRFAEGDTVGCGVNLATGRIILTKNGLRLDTTKIFAVTSSADGPLFPCVSLCESNDKIVANFGPNFKFDPSAVEVLLNPHKNCWDDAYCHKQIQIFDDDSLMVIYNGGSNGWRSVFAEQSTFYFEIKLAVVKNFALVGFAYKKEPFTEIRERRGTFAFEGDATLWADGSGREGHVKFSRGDVVGCAIIIRYNPRIHQIIFTKNGQRLETADLSAPYSADDPPLFPCISLQNSGDLAVANFGPNFKFDVSTING